MLHPDWSCLSKVLINGFLTTILELEGGVVEGILRLYSLLQLVIQHNLDHLLNHLKA